MTTGNSLAVSHTPRVLDISSTSPNATMQTLNHTKAQALRQLGNNIQKSQGDRVIDICIGAQKHGANDLTRKEIQSIWENQDSKRIEISTVARTVNGLVASKRLVVLSNPRMCSVTGKTVEALQVPLAQTRLVY